MDPASRYEIVDTIASGDFATIYRARDRELGREVAIKQIHQQFLSDPQQLARYWQEAQLLASLQHPNILTIYDVVRHRGWLILELMRGSLKDTCRGRPIDLDLLRVALVGCLGGLQFLHTNGVIHGDVKPGNLLVDARNRVVLADFGLARRASNEEGSLLKGTTKYMAPELVSNQFGAVGPASDLYSLGFSAYELICGEQFESLFPGLATFGRDKQIAWMMWHAAADRNLPDIARVLEGVPDDLARVIQKLVVKDQARRYPSARDALRDLRTDPLMADQPPEEEDPEAIAAAEAAARKKRRLRFAAVLACAFSLMLCLAQLWPEKKRPGPAGPPTPTRGAITQVYPDERKLALTSGEDGTASEIEFTRYDQFFVNDDSVTLRELQPDDEVVIKRIRDESGRRIQQVFAYRPKIHKGRIKTVEADEGEFVLTIDEGDQKGQELLISVPPELEIVFNAHQGIAKQPVQLADLQVNDRAVVHHKGAEAGRVAVKLEVERVVDLPGILIDVDAKRRRLTVAVGEPGDPEKPEKPQKVVLTWAPDCDVTINHLTVMDRRELKPADLQPGDKVTIAHGSQAVRIDAYRVLGEGGVVQKVHFAARRLDVIPEGGGKPIPYSVGPECKITLAGEPAELTDLRDGDIVEVQHDSPGAESPEALSVAALRPPDSSRWAMLIGIQSYDDVSLSRLAHPAADAQLLRDVLIDRYRVPRNQAELLTNESLVRLEQTIPDWLGRIGPRGRVIVYFAGHAYQDDQQKVYLAPKDFSLKRIESTGLPLQWLVDQLEQCPAEEKLLLLDASHTGTGADLARQPSTAEMIQTLDAPSGRSPLRTVAAVVSCQAGQRGHPIGGTWNMPPLMGREAKDHGLFPWLLAEAYSGRADKNRDNRLEATELFEFLNGAMAAAGGLPSVGHGDAPPNGRGGVQTPGLILPDDTPPRLAEDAKKAIRRLAFYFRQTRIDVEAAGQQYNAAKALASGEPEPQLLYALLLLKAMLREDALTQFGELKVDHPQLLVPVQGMAWVHCQGKSYNSGVRELQELLSNVPKPKRPTDPYPEQHQEIFKWAGQIREFAADAPKPAEQPQLKVLEELQAAVADHGDRAVKLYEQGRSLSRAVLEDFDKQIGQSANAATVARLKVERRQLVHYAQFPFESIVQRVLDGLDE